MPVLQPRHWVVISLNGHADEGVLVEFRGSQMEEFMPTLHGLAAARMIGRGDSGRWGMRCA
ncbi:MAG: hypothetical protein Q9M30_02810 [Mariprofundaceae bacterium]|nr:hypothetical protein [Mariprofundaceae bacterium]